MIHVSSVITPGKSVGNSHLAQMHRRLKVMTDLVKVAIGPILRHRHGTRPETPGGIALAVVESVAGQMRFRITYSFDRSR